MGFWSRVLNKIGDAVAGRPSEQELQKQLAHFLELRNLFQKKIESREYLFARSKSTGEALIAEGRSLGNDKLELKKIQKQIDEIVALMREYGYTPKGV